MTAAPFTTYLASTHLNEAVLLHRAYKQMARAVGDFGACEGRPGFTAADLDDERSLFR